MLPRLMTLCKSVSGKTRAESFNGVRIATGRLRVCANPSSDRLRLTHVLENQINVPVVVRLVQPDQPDDVLVIGERQQEHDLTERTLRVRLIPKSVEDLLHRDRVLPFLLDRLPYYTVSLRKRSALSLHCYPRRN